MPRLLFVKNKKSIWISHLDLMRVFQRAFKRAGLPLTHTQGFNPRPSVSIALPLSVGVESSCELLDFNLDDSNEISLSEIKERLNSALIEGVYVLDVYPNGQKIRELSYLNCKIVLGYNQTLPCDAYSRLVDLFSCDTIMVEKKTKSGLQEQNIIPMIKSITISEPMNNMVVLDAVICCQNPTLNPNQIVLAVSKYLPDLTPDYINCNRIEIYDKNMAVFR